MSTAHQLHLMLLFCWSTAYSKAYKRTASFWSHMYGLLFWFYLFCFANALFEIHIMDAAYDTLVAYFKQCRPENGTVDTFDIADEITARYRDVLSPADRKALFRRLVAAVQATDVVESGQGVSGREDALDTSPFPLPQASSVVMAEAAAGALPVTALGSDAARPTDNATTSAPTPSPRDISRVDVDFLYIQQPKRCVSERMPHMPRRLHPPKQCTSTAAPEAWRAYERAETVIDNGQVGDEWYSAIELLSYAESLFVSAVGAHPQAERYQSASREDVSPLVMAGNCCVRCADCHRCLSQLDDMSSALSRAADHYLAAGGCGDAAVKAMTQAVFVACSAERPVKAAKLARKGAEVAADAQDFATSITFLTRAKELYEEHGMLGEARACLTRAVAIALIDLQDVAVAIDVLEKLADISLPEEQPLVLFRAMLCRLSCIPEFIGNDTDEAITDCEYVLDQYSDLCVALCGGRENECLKSMLRGVRENDPLRIENAIDTYTACHHALDTWVLPLMQVTWQRAVSRLAQQVERFRLQSHDVVCA